MVIPVQPTGASAFAVPVLRSLPPTRPAAGTIQPETLVEHRFEAMGTRCHIMLVDSDPRLLLLAEEEVRRLEQLWTRFDPGSELNRLNSRSGHWSPVSPELALLVQRSCIGYSLTNGFFNPFLGAEIVAAGYDRDFDQLLAVSSDAAALAVAATRPNGRRVRRHRSSGRSRLRAPAQLKLRRGLVRIREGAHIDSGGIGKGLGADLVSDLLLRSGAAGALVNLGGDLRVRGRTPQGGFRIALDDPFDPERPPHSTVTLHAGGLCTSTPLRRRWQRPEGAGVAHHIIDPRSGHPLRTNLAAVTAIATSGWLAEVWAKAGLIAGPQRAVRLLRRSPTSSCLVVAGDGSVVQLTGLPAANRVTRPQRRRRR